MMKYKFFLMISMKSTYGCIKNPIYQWHLCRSIFSHEILRILISSCRLCYHLKLFYYLLSCTAQYIIEINKKIVFFLCLVKKYKRQYSPPAGKCLVLHLSLIPVNKRTPFNWTERRCGTLFQVFLYLLLNVFFFFFGNSLKQSIT